jgi:maltose alpha-D-glucosyltransferase/alpha-amylase
MVVANLSRFVQPAELDLAEFKGRIPVEMIGRTEFPAIGDLPYFITLGPHSFYWFRLESPAEPIKAVRAATAELQKLPLLTLDKMWDTLLEPEYLFALCNDVLPPYLAGQRWFRGKAKDLTSCSLIDWCKLGASFFITFLRLQYDSGEQEDYVVPMKITQGQPARTLAEEIPDSILAFVKNRRGDGILYDALMDRASYDILFNAIGDERHYGTVKGGTIKALPTAIYDELIDSGQTCTSVRKVGAEQSNTSIIIEDAFVLKLYRKMEQGINPDVEMNLFLTEKSRFTAIARVVGTIQYLDPAGHAATVGMLQEFVANRGDGWSYALSALQDYYKEAAERLGAGESAPVMDRPLMEAAQVDPPAAFAGMTADFLPAIRLLGKRTAQLHLALAEEKKDPAFKPEKASTAFTAQLAEAVIRQIQEALATLSGKITELPAGMRKDADRVLSDGPAVLDRIGEMPEIGDKLGYLIRHHGDYHLGQVLRTEDRDFIILDFEGEPLHSLAQRRRKGSPLKDIAGMIRSFHYAARSALPAAAAAGLASEDLLPWSQAWYEWTSSVFVGAYLAAAGGAPFLPTADTDFMLDVFLLEKVFYELQYELNNRPDWIDIPLAGIVEILGRIKTGKRKK